MSLQIQDDIKEYYGKILSGKNDLKTTACCAAGAPPAHIREALQKIPAEVHERFYGCGTPFPAALEGTTVLDLGCGTGRDCFVLSQLVGASGRVIGIDMTQAQLDLANKHNLSFAKTLNRKETNIDFRLGYIEDLTSADVATGSVDVVISNCVLNLSPRKDLVIAEISRVLKKGGELYFSDVFVDRRLSAALQTDAVVVGECLGGALYMQDFRRAMAVAGFLDFRIVARNPIEITNVEIKEKTGQARFESITVRAFKLDIEDACEDYGQALIYKGTEANNNGAFTLDDHHVFEKGRVVPVCRNTSQMIMESRFAMHFELVGQGDTHYGLFDCAPAATQPTTSAGCC